MFYLPVSVTSQTNTFLLSIGGGIASAFIFDLFRIRRRTIKACRYLVYAEDIIYWTLLALLIFVFVYFINEGEIRGYIFIGMILGATVYFLTASRFVIRILAAFFKFLFMFIGTFIKVILAPFIQLVRITARILKKINALAGKCLKALSDRKKDKSCKTKTK